MSSGMMPGYFNGGAAINKQAREWTLKTVSVNESTNQSRMSLRVGHVVLQDASLS